MALVHHAVGILDIPGERHGIEQWCCTRLSTACVWYQPAFPVHGKINGHPFIGLCCRRDEIRHLDRI